MVVPVPRFFSWMYTLLTGGKTQKRQTDVEDLVHPSPWVPTQGLGCLPGDLFLGRAPGLVPSSASWPLGSHAENRQALLAQIYGPKGWAHLHTTFVPWALVPQLLISLVVCCLQTHIFICCLAFLAVLHGKDRPTHWFSIAGDFKGLASESYKHQRLQHQLAVLLGCL